MVCGVERGQRPSEQGSSWTPGEGVCISEQQETVCPVWLPGRDMVPTWQETWCTEGGRGSPLLLTMTCWATGIFFSSGARWRAARQFTVRTLHDLGVGRGPMADKILQELRCLVGQLDSYGGE